jgi:hypothetical protein
MSPVQSDTGAERLGLHVRVDVAMQGFGPQLCAPAQHVLILVARDKRDLPDRIPRLEQPGRALMAQFVKMEVRDSHELRGALECRGDALGRMRKNATPARPR